MILKIFRYIEPHKAIWYLSMFLPMCSLNTDQRLPVARGGYLSVSLSVVADSIMLAVYLEHTEIIPALGYKVSIRK